MAKLYYIDLYLTCSNDNPEKRDRNESAIQPIEKAKTMKNERTKPLKIYAGKPLYQFLDTSPVKADTCHALSEFTLKGISTVSGKGYTKMCNLDKNPISNSTKINRLAERYLFLRQQNFPILSFEAWRMIINNFTGRTELYLEEICEMAQGDVEYAPGVEGTEYQELTSLTLNQCVYASEFSEYYWGGGGSKEVTLEGSLSIFFGVYVGYCLKESNDYDFKDHWDSEVIEDPISELCYALTHKNGYKIYMWCDPKISQICCRDHGIALHPHDKKRIDEDLLLWKNDLFSAYL
jgi:hypothetical protein